LLGGRMDSFFIHDVITDEDHTAGHQSAVNLAEKLQILSGTILVNDGGKKGEITAGGENVFIKTSAHDQDTVRESFGLEPLLRQMNYIRQIEQHCSECGIPLEKRRRVGSRTAPDIE